MPFLRIPIRLSRLSLPRSPWLICLIAAAVIALASWATAGTWSVAIGRGLVCHASRIASDAIVIDNLDPDYPSFVRARELRHSGFTSRVLVPVPAGQFPAEMDAIAREHALMLARASGVGSIELVNYRATEPISLQAARAIRDFIRAEQFHTVLVVTPLFRSRRTMLIYEAVLGAAGIVTHCEPVGVTRDPLTWTSTWHGIQAVAEQWLKLIYYRLTI